MPTFKFEKLVRDNIKQMHEDAGHEVYSRQLENDELRQALCEKLHEEADEVADAKTKQEMTDELADMYQILQELRDNAGISEAEVQQVLQAEQQRRGGFITGLYIEKVTMPDENNKWVAYCRERPGKYPELQE